MKDILLILATALLPVVVLFIYIYWRDRNRREPLIQLVKGLVFGIIAAFASFLISQPFESIGLYDNESMTLLGHLRNALFGAAIPEECAKLFMLWLLLRRNKHYDEYFDGIVYASTIGLGFAGIENILYLFSNADHWMTVGITRALFSVPGHFFFAVFMGYYYSLTTYSPSKDKGKYAFLMLAIPIVTHTMFDACLMMLDSNWALNMILLILFLLLCHYQRTRSLARMAEYIKKDKDLMTRRKDRIQW